MGAGMRIKQKILSVALILMLALAFSSASAAGYAKAPVELQAKVFSKVFLFNNKLIKGGDIVVHVIDSAEFAAELRKLVGKKMGKSKLAAVTENVGLPAEKPSVIYLGDPSKLGEVIKYSRSEKILSITGVPELVEKGITLGVGVKEKKLQILFNSSSSKIEEMDWNPVILKICKIIK